MIPWDVLFLGSPIILCCVLSVISSIVDPSSAISDGFIGNWPVKDQSVIPAGIYCYDQNGLCPYWSSRADKHHQENGYCSFLEVGDWEVKGCSLLWDQVKECGVNCSWDEED